MDILDKLRFIAEHPSPDIPAIAKEAIDEIERLRAVAGQARPSDFNAVKKEAKS